MEDIKDLKARAYDLIAALEQIQRELQQVNQKIAEIQAL
jgi:prefoldin subunit 5